MNEIYSLYWQDKLVGGVGDLRNDMWYYEGQFLSKEVETFEAFCGFLKKHAPEFIFDHPSEEFIVYLSKDGSKPIRFLALKLEQDRIYMRVLAS